MKPTRHTSRGSYDRPGRSSGSKATASPLSRGDAGAALNLFFDVLAVFAGWTLHPACFLAVLWLSLVATSIAIHYWSRVFVELRYVWQSFPFLPLLMGSMVQTVMLLNLPHALMTGMGCRVFGGRVRAMTLTFYGGVFPVIHVDVGDSLAFMKEEDRKVFLWWDILFPLMMGALFTLAWAVARPGSSASRFFICMFIPAILAFLLRFNVFMRIGMYWVLCSAYEEWGLHDRALAETRAWLNWRLAPEALSRGQRYWFRFYGVSYYVYRVLADLIVLIGFGLWLVHTFPNATFWAYPAFVAWWYRDALGSALMAVKPVYWIVRGGGPWWLRWSVRLACLAGLWGVGLIRYNYEIVGDCEIFPAAEFGIRAHLADEVVQLRVSEGDFVEAGSVVATLSARDAGAQFKMSQQDVASAQANLDLLTNGPRKEDIAIAVEQVDICQNQLVVAEKKLVRTATLFEKKMSSDAELEQARKGRDNAKSSLLSARQELSKLSVGYREESIRSARASLKHAEEKLKHDEEALHLTQITTPISGHVVTRHLGSRQGIHSQKGDLIATVQDTSSVWVEVAADEAAAVDVRRGMLVKVRLYGLDSGRLLYGHVYSLAPIAEPASLFGIDTYRSDPESNNEQFATAGSKNDRRVRVVVQLDDYPDELVPGMDGYARIIANTDDVFWRALARPVVRFFRTDVWSWLP
jgi:HlyD family secretion protein